MNEREVGKPLLRNFVFVQQLKSVDRIKNSRHVRSRFRTHASGNEVNEGWVETDQLADPLAAAPRLNFLNPVGIESKIQE